jgi:hypothetical protein
LHVVYYELRHAKGGKQLDHRREFGTVNVGPDKRHRGPDLVFMSNNQGSDGPLPGIFPDQLVMNRGISRVQRNLQFTKPGFVQALRPVLPERYAIAGQDRTLPFIAQVPDYLFEPGK